MAVGREVYAGFREADVLEALLKKAGIPVSSSQDLNAEPFTALGDSTTVKEPDNLESFPYEDLGTSMAQGRSLEDGDLTRVTESCELVDEFPHETLAAPQADEIPIVIPPDVLASTLDSLYLDYRQSIPNLQAMLPSQSMVDSVATDDAAVVREEYAMSKTQQQLIEEEGKFWQEFTEHGGQETSGVAINALAEKSSIISESYERRTNPPSVETYEESKMILHAMGVPCIETSGPYEAEALASSLVIHGHADYVASEDTVIYFFP